VYKKLLNYLKRLIITELFKIINWWTFLDHILYVCMCLCGMVFVVFWEVFYCCIIQGDNQPLLSDVAHAVASKLKSALFSQISTAGWLSFYSYAFTGIFNLDVSSQLDWVEFCADRTKEWFPLPLISTFSSTPTVFTWLIWQKYYWATLICKT